METDKSPVPSPNKSPEKNNKDLTVEVKVELDDAWPIVCQAKDDDIENMIANMTDENENSGSGDTTKPSGSSDWAVAIKRKHFDSSDSESDVSLDVYNFPLKWTSLQIKEFIQKQCGPVRKITLEVGKGSDSNYVNVVLENSSQRDSALKTLNSIQLEGKQLNAVNKNDEGDPPKSTTPFSCFAKIKRMEGRLRSSPDQFGVMIDFMERNNDIGRPQSGPQGRRIADGLWLELTDILNSVRGGVQRPVDKWKKIWADWKTKTKKKALTIGREFSGNGGEPYTRQNLTALEKRVLTLMVTGQEALEERTFTLTLEPAAAESPPAPVAPRCPTPPARLEAEDPHHTTYQCDPPSPVQEDCMDGAMSPASPEPERRRMQRAVRVRRHRRRNVTPFERAAEDFVAVEEERLRLEEERDKRMHTREIERERWLHEREVEKEKLLHEREMERLRVESLRLEIENRQNSLLQGLLEFLQKKF